MGRAACIAAGDVSHQLGGSKKGLLWSGLAGKRPDESFPVSPVERLVGDHGQADKLDAEGLVQDPPHLGQLNSEGVMLVWQDHIEANVAAGQHCAVA